MEKELSCTFFIFPSGAQANSSAADTMVRVVGAIMVVYWSFYLRRMEGCCNVVVQRFDEIYL